MKDAGRIHEYFNGIVEGVRLYAWWKDGEQYVGTCGKTLKEAISDIEGERKEALTDKYA
jgi:predicted heme/steroid binding protein